MKNIVLRLASVMFIIALVFSVLSSKTQAASALDSIEIQGWSVDPQGDIAPGSGICFHVTVKVNDGQLLESRGDMLLNTDDKLLYGHWPHIAVKGIVNAGQLYTFNCYSGMVAPTTEGTYESKWRVWREGSWVGPEVIISFVVSNGGGSGTPPVPPPFTKDARCVATEATTGHVDDENGTHHFVELTIPSGVPQITQPSRTGAYSDILTLNSWISTFGSPVNEWFIEYHEVNSIVPDRHWRIFVPDRVLLIPSIFINYHLNPGSMVYLRCKIQDTPTIFDQFLQILKDWSIVAPTSGTQLRVPIEVPSWMAWIQTDLRKGSNATITLIAPDGTVYLPTSSAVTYTDTPSFAVHTLNLDTPQGGTWQVVIDVISADSDSVFMLNVNGKQINVPSNDNIPPVTGMHFDGIKGQNAWFTSNVTVTLSATDDPGGSGIQGIEWSTDNGVTWNKYVNPFVVSQEGLSYVLARSYDNAGNYDQSPIGKYLSIDKTPPVVSVSTDQSEYTRVQPFVVHYSGYDPEPGSGLASLAATFNGQSVTDGQSIDMFWWNLGQYTLSATGVDYAGWDTTDSKSIKLIATIQSMQQTVGRLCTEKYITKKGICTSLQQKLKAALSAQQRGQKKTAVNILSAFQKALKAQKGKAVKLQAYDLLMMDSNYVITTLGGKKGGK